MRKLYKYKIEYYCNYCNTCDYSNNLYQCTKCSKSTFSKDCKDCKNMSYCTSCIDSINCTKSQYLKECKNCISCQLCTLCENCTECSDCVGIKNGNKIKNYDINKSGIYECYYNKQYEHIIKKFMKNGENKYELSRLVTDVYFVIQCVSLGVPKSIFPKEIIKSISNNKLI